MDHDVQIVHADTNQDSANRDFVRVCTSSDPKDDTVTLATIQRVIARPAGKQESWRIKTLIQERPMSLDAAVGLATCYAKRKNIRVVYTESACRDERELDVSTDD